MIVGKDTEKEVDFRNKNEPIRDSGSKSGNKMVVLHGPQRVNKKKEIDPRINEVGLGSDILFLVNNTRDNKSNRKFHQQHKNK